MTRQALCMYIQGADFAKDFADWMELDGFLRRTLRRTFADAKDFVEYPREAAQEVQDKEDLTDKEFAIADKKNKIAVSFSPS